MLAASLARLRPPRRVASMRRLLAVIAAAASAAVLAAAVAVMAGGGAEGISQREIVEFGTAPVPVSEPGSTAGRPQVVDDDLAAPPEVPAPPAPAIPVRSGFIDEVPAPDRAEPVGLLLSGIGVSAPVAHVGYDAGVEEMEVPRSAHEVGWYRFGASPGQAGSAVLAAHVDFNGVAGAFYDLHLLEAGDPVVVVMDDGTRQRWEVVARRQYGKELLPTDAIFNRGGEPTLALITCGGPFDGRRYEDNVVVFARPAGAPAADPGPA